MVSVSRPHIPPGETWSTGGNENTQSRPVAKKLLYQILLKWITGDRQARTQQWMWQNLKPTSNWRKRRRKANCADWPRSTTFGRCCRAAKTYVLHKKNFGLNTSTWQPYDIFQILRRLTKHPGRPCNRIVRQDSNWRKHQRSHQLWLQTTSLHDELKYWILTKWWESAVIQQNVIRIVQLKEFRTTNIGLTGKLIWMIQICAKITGRQTINTMQN